jgi:hydroxymethylglutaryl-CoA synthase
MVKHLPESTVRRLGIFAHGEEMVQVHRDEPIFDGQFSNRCYQEAVKTAFLDFQRKAIKDKRYNSKEDEILTSQWIRIIMHLPYAFQAKRMFPDVFRHDRRDEPVWAEIVANIGSEPERENFEDTPEGEIEWEKSQDVYRRAISKTEQYQEFHEQRIEKGQRASSLIGNQYTGSIFLAIMSTFESDYEDNENIEENYFGMCGYGSGAKAKVFEGLVSPRWREVVSRWNLFERMAGRVAIDQTTYEALHKGLREESVVEPKGEFALVEIESEGVYEGARTYRWVA